MIWNESRSVIKHMRACTCTCMHACMRTHMHACMHIHARAHRLSFSISLNLGHMAERNCFLTRFEKQSPTATPQCHYSVLLLLSTTTTKRRARLDRTRHGRVVLQGWRAAGLNVAACDACNRCGMGRARDAHTVRHDGARQHPRVSAGQAQARRSEK